MTHRQKQVFDFIREFWAEHSYGPTYREIMIALGFCSKGSLHAIVRRLEERGHIRIATNPELINSVARGIIPIFPRSRAA